MSVIQPSLSRFWAWLVRTALLMAGALLRAVLFLLTASAGAVEMLRQRADSRRVTLSIAAARNARAANRWRTAFEEAPLGMARVSLDGRLEDANSAFRALLGEPQRAIVGRRLSAFVYPDDLPALGDQGNPGNPANLAKGVAKAEVRLVCTGGRLKWCELSSSVVRDAYERPEYVLASAVDITRHKRSQAALRDLATRDPLSGLSNRRWFELQLAQHLRLCAEEGPVGALLVMDLDQFKQVNDNLGHQAGDRLIIGVALTLRRHLRDQDIVSRLGGDEFAVVLREGDRWAAEAVARKLVLAVRDEVRAQAVGDGEPLVINPEGALGSEIYLVDGPEAGSDATRPGQAPSHVASGRGAGTSPGQAGNPWRGEEGGQGREATFGVSISIGVAPFEVLSTAYDLASSSAARDALRAADTALYAVKRSGRNGYAVSGAEEGPRHARPRSSNVPDLSEEDLAASPAAQAPASTGAQR
ncbi:MAG TPA: diguanylate cyclase [Acidimicrobiales bacterium]|nr:diguanylate cyclase [Acidimicrobiales bacterium]